MVADISWNEGRGPTRQKKTYWWIVIVVSIVAGVGLVLYFSIPIFFSPGGGIGAPTNIEAEQQPPTARGTSAGELPSDGLIPK
jgi:hypothetical protein